MATPCSRPWLPPTRCRGWKKRDDALVTRSGACNAERGASRNDRFAIRVGTKTTSWMRCPPSTRSSTPKTRAIPITQETVDVMQSVLATSTTVTPVNQVIDLAVDAWSVSGGSAASLKIPPGIETKLFQAGLAPYLVYLFFLGKKEVGTPNASLVGARFLLLFVIATIPAGVVAKTQYGDILANVDLLHGSSESLLSVSNFLFCAGFLGAARDYSGRDVEGMHDSGSTAVDSSVTREDTIQSEGFGTGRDDADGDTSSAANETSSAANNTSSTSVSPYVALLLFAAVSGAGSFCAGQLLHGGDFLQNAFPSIKEPRNALSTQTWAVHVSSCTEWAIAMVCVKRFAITSGNTKWNALPIAMVPFLASGLAACTFHLFRNDPSINALVPLQALLTLTGNVGCAFAAFAIYKEAEALNFSKGTKGTQGTNGTNGTNGSDDASLALRDGDGTVRNLRMRKQSASAGDGSHLSVSKILQFSAFTVSASLLATAAPLGFGGFFETPSYAKAISLIAMPTVLWSVCVFSCWTYGADEASAASKSREVEGVSTIDSDDSSAEIGSQNQSQKETTSGDGTTSSPEEESTQERTVSGFTQVKKFGQAGVVSYVLVELVFWAVALPGAVAWYRVAEGSWLDLNDPIDKAKLLGASAVFVNGARFLVPFRLAAALALAPVVERTFFVKEGKEGKEGKDDE